MNPLPATIPEALFATAERDAGEYVFHLEEGMASFSCAELAERAVRGAQRLIALGVEPGETVGVLGPNRPEWVVSAFAAWIAGAVLMPIQVPVRIRDREAFSEQLHRLVEVGDCRCVLAHPALAELLPPGIAIAWDGASGRSAEALAHPAPQDVAVVQFTSGSTAAPRGALITHGAAMAQMEILDGLVVGPAGPRTSVNWVPFFHDMGLFLTVLAPAVWGATGHYLPTERFARDPGEWLRLVGERRAAMTLGPSTAFGSALRSLGRRDESVDLSSLEIARLVAEAVDPEVARRLTEAAPGFGLRLETLGSGYGLAEGVLAVTLSVPGTGLRFDRISLDALALDGVAVPAEVGHTRAIASSGPPLMDLRIIGPGGGELPERQVGGIHLRGPSLMSGYLSAEDQDPFVDGWLRTGDLGYLADGELYVTGRAKDMVIALGHNYYPEDFEWAAARVDGVRPGRCVAFARPGTEDVVVLVEARDGGSQGELRRAVRGAVLNAVGIAPSEVVVLPPDTVQKTTSGKLRRAAMRAEYARGTLTAGMP